MLDDPGNPNAIGSGILRVAHALDAEPRHAGASGIEIQLPPINLDDVFDYGRNRPALAGDDTFELGKKSGVR